MEGEVEDSDDDVQGEDKRTLLWEKCIQQTIFVDLSEDESLHLSDLESSLALHLSQEESIASEASIHLSGNAELSALDVSSSEESIGSSQSEKVVETESSPPHESAPRLETTPEESPLNHLDLEQNTSDEDQDDLPYDGDLGTPSLNQTPSSEGSSSDGRETIHASPDSPGLHDRSTRDGDIGPQTPVTSNNTKQESRLNVSKPGDVSSSCPADINQLLLRHFSQEELLRLDRLIEAETLPEVSLLESIDDTVTSWAPTHRSKNNNSDTSDKIACYSESKLIWTEEKIDTASKNVPSDREEEENADHVTSAAADGITSTADGAGDASEQEKTGEDDPVQRSQLVRTRSLSEMKYGQGQVHYPLPDFSKVAPKVKIPRAPCGPARPAPHGPVYMHRTQSSPGMLDLISKVLEDSIQPSETPYIFNSKVKTPAALADPCSDLTVFLECKEEDQQNLPAAEGNHLGSSGPHLPPAEHSGGKEATAPHGSVKEVNTGSPEEAKEGSSDGEQMTAELRGIIVQFMQMVEEFRLSISSMSLSTAEQQTMLRGIMEAQDQMERKYISKKEEHRALERQNYMGLCRNTGTFDPNRLVEGDIFRIGMHIEDIKEMIDKNVCEQISPPHVSSTPTPMKEMLDMKPSPLCLPPPSPPPSLHEGLSAAFSTAGFQTEKWGDQEVVEDSGIHRERGLKESDELMTSDSLLKTTAHLPRRTQGSLEEQNTHTAEAEEKRSAVSSEAGDHRDDILDFLSGVRSSSRQSQWKPDSSCSTPESVLNPVGECCLGVSASLAVGVSSSSDAPRDSDTHSFSEPPLNTSSVLQRIVSPETDSGFGSFYLNQSASEQFQPDQLTESVQHQNEAFSSSDSEDSHLQTTVHPASLTSQRWTSTHPFVETQSCDAAVEVQQWAQSTDKKFSVRSKESEKTTPAHLHHHTSEATLKTAMHAEKSPLHACSRNSEAILALQSEVSKLRSDLEEGLVQLPHLALKMDYLTSKYRQDHLERRSKTRTQSHQRSTCSSVRKLSNNQQIVRSLSSCQVRIDDWISSDLEPSKSKGTNSDESASEEEALQFHKTPLGGRATAGFQHDPHWAVGSSREEIMDRCPSGSKWPLFSPQRPLLQVGFASSSSLPASYKVREPLPQSTSHGRKRSTQSDSALLPTNVFFQRTTYPASGPTRASTRTGRHRGTKEERLSRALDQAIEVAYGMKRTTARMAKTLSADLVKAQLHRTAHSMQPLGGRKHHTV
ncbi:microtubule organization protein AKNA-like [Antennarius striatus]|uniref:microtubule organization protein AKNA-like n=1 Tax=Antennarius striatus TaxID=241820 RepID=UPI0035B3DB43